MAGSTSDIAVASTALQLIGHTAISSLAENAVANNIYDDVVEALIGGYPWTFAKKQSDVLSRLDATPDTKWDAAYQLPSDLLDVRTAMVNDIPIDYEVYGDQLYCNESSDAEIVVDYTYAAPVAVWTPSFRFVVELKLASLFALAIAMKPSLATAFAEQFEVEHRKAKTQDAQRQTTKKVSTSRFLLNRR
jgi:hypothetical protein